MAKNGGAPNKSDILNSIIKETGLSRKDSNAVLSALQGIIGKSLRKNGMFTLPGLLKLKVVKKPPPRRAKA